MVGEPGKPKKKGAKLPTAQADWRAVPAGAINSKDALGDWETELAKYGFAIIHNKIVVIDPFSANCTVVTGSHNLGFRASHNNDENMVIIRGHRGLAEAYACHVLDIYDHYAWRFLLKAASGDFGKPLEGDDKWQERYIAGPDVKSPELRFWLAAASGGDSLVVAPAARARQAVSLQPGASSRREAAGRRRRRPRRRRRRRRRRKRPRQNGQPRPRQKAAKKSAKGKAAKKSKAGKKTAKKTQEESRQEENSQAKKTAKKARPKKRIEFGAARPKNKTPPLRRGPVLVARALLARQNVGQAGMRSSTSCGSRST